MKLVRCERGHYYDEEKCDACPHCADITEVLYGVDKGSVSSPVIWKTDGRSETSHGMDVGREPLPVMWKTDGHSEATDLILPYELGLFQIKELLSQGGASKVFRLETKQKYVLKVVDITDIMAAHMAENEYKISQWLNDDKYFVKYYAMYKWDGKAYFVQPELRNLVTYIREEHPDFRHILNIFKDVAQAIISLHENGIIHLDIKPTNIFVDDNGNGKLGDFSVSCKIIDYKEQPVNGGTLNYVSPEVVRQSGYSGKEDMYSFGITMYNILSSGKFPYDYSEITIRCIEPAYIDDAHIPEFLQNMIKKATAFNPSDRYADMGELLAVLQSAGQIADEYPSFNFMPLKEEGRTMSNIPDDRFHGEEQKASSGGRPASGSDYIFCRACGARLAKGTIFCEHCGAAVKKNTESQGTGMKLESNQYSIAESKAACNCASKPTAVSGESALEISKVRFSAVAPRTLIKGDYTMIDIVMYEDSFRSIVDELVKEAEAPVKETKSGPVKVREGARVKIQLTTPDFSIEDNVEEQEWCGEYLIFNFAVMLPENYDKRQVLFMATVYIDDVIAARLKFIAKCWSLRQQKIKVTQEDVLSAFVSYASKDRNRVAMIVQGMQKARPDMDIFFDVESLRSGESWEEALWSEIDRRDTLFLCWSHNAKESEWVEREWRYAFNNKGAEGIEPIPLEPPSSCPPPEELQKKHFNDRLLYVIEAENSADDIQIEAAESERD